MNARLAAVLYVLLMIAVIVFVDITFFRHRFWERLTANVVLVIAFALFYLRFLTTR